MKNYLKTAFAFLTVMSVLVSCSDDENDASNESYDTTFKITDAPIDDSNVEAVFVTVTDVKVDGTSLEGFTKTTFNLAALVNGQTKTLGNLKMQQGTYSNIKLELDYDTDVNGNAPGCYVMTANGEKDKLEATANSIDISNTFEVFAQSTNEIVIDFDLRKTIKEEESTFSSNFEFVSMSELSSGIRVVNQEITGDVSGTVSDSGNTSDKIIVYAYEQGTFDANTETSGSGESNVTFANAVTSSEVKGINNAYSLNFLAEGEYEMVFVSYNDESTGYKFNSLLTAESATGLNLGAINVTSSVQLSSNIIITGTK